MQLDKFYALCQDELWGVRKACAEVFMSLSRVVSAAKRRQEFSTLFVNLLQDESRWVRMAAFQALGPFISTFSRADLDSADAAVAEMAAETQLDRDFNSFNYWRDPLPEVDPVELTKPQSPPPPPPPASPPQESVSDSVEKALEDLMARVELGAAPAEQTATEPVHAFDLRRVACQELLGSPTTVSAEPPSYETIAAAPESNLPPPPPLGLSFVTPPLSSIVPSPGPGHQSSGALPPAYKSPSSASGDLSFTNSFYPYYTPRRRSDTRPYSPHDSSRSSTCSLSSSQTVVPQNLMDYYLQMTDPYYVETVDSEITRHCAYSLPAVVCTLGKEHWPLLRDLYTTLASDMQWKVRRTLAFSIHEIAGVLERDVVVRDLLPVFDGFLKDLDEVRVGVLKHLGQFLRLLPERERRGYLPRLADFLKLDNEQNWRFRQELALQLQAAAVLYSPTDSAQSILPLALTLASDRVAAVRRSAFALVSQVVKQVSDSDGCEVTGLLAELTARFCTCSRWMLRQSYVSICNQLVTDRALPPDQFARLLLDPLLALRRDRVPNVRLVLARIINLQLKYHGTSESARASVCSHVRDRVFPSLAPVADFFAGSDSPYRELLNETLVDLSKDPDRDVSFFATVKRENAPAFLTGSLIGDESTA